MPMGFKFGNTTSASLGLVVRGKDVPLMPPIDERTENIAGMDGSWDFGVRFGAKQITVDVSMYQASRTALNQTLRDLAGLLNPRAGAKELIFDDEPDKLYYARLTDKFTPDKIGGMYGSFQLQFICNDPFTYATVPTSFTAAAQITAPHLGSHVSRPTLTVTKNAGAATITNTRADGIIEKMIFKSTSPAGTYIINNKEFTITLAGAGAYKHFDETTFFNFPTGNNVLTWGANITNVKADYRNTWL